MTTTHDIRKLLELAAKAAGITHLLGAWFDDGATAGFLSGRLGNGRSVWNPAADDGDSRRLAVALHLIVGAYASHASVGETFDKEILGAAGEEFVCWYSETGNDPCAATRLAVLRAAAAIGKAMS